MNQANGHGVVGKVCFSTFTKKKENFLATRAKYEFPRFSIQQYCGTSSHQRMSYVGRIQGTVIEKKKKWFQMERENGSTFQVNIPTIVLESQEERHLDAATISE